MRDTTDRMPEFFIPHVVNDPDAHSEEVWATTKKFMEDEHHLRPTDQRIFRLDYVHDDKHELAEVGVPHPAGWLPDWDNQRDPDAEGEHVVVIFETEDDGPYLVCTESRGVRRGEPILVGFGEVYGVTYFDGYDP
jgi:hypothetical protein